MCEDSLAYPVHQIMTPADRSGFTSSFHMWASFASFSCEIAPARTLRVEVNRSGESRRLDLDLDLSGKRAAFYLGARC